MRQLIEVRVLGTFLVRTSDGELVGERAWRTAKTRDLLRLLAVAGKPVPVERLIDVLWPGAEPAHGRGSLRTAASHLRHVLGEGCLVRRGEGLELTGAWVDAAAFSARAATARHQLADGDISGGLAAAWEAVVLYGGDLCADVSADWPREDRDHLRQLLRRLLVDAGEGACAAGWWRDAVELGHLALDFDPCAERAYRVLMRAYSGLGETEQALRMFHRCRRILVEQFGADPDDRTQALHLQLLRARAPAAPTAPFVARGPLLAEVRRTMAEVVEQGRPRAVVVTGPTGIGRTRFLREAASVWSHRTVALTCRPAGADQPGGLLREVRQALDAGLPPTSRAVEDLRGLLSGEPLLLVIDDVHHADAESLVILGRLLQDAAQPVLVLTAAPAELPRGHPLTTTSRCRPLQLPVLVREEVAELLTQVLKGAPSRSLVDELADGSEGRPGELLDTVRRLLDSGQLLTTADGMVRVPRSPGGGRVPTAGPLLAAARERVGPAGADVLDLMAVLDRPATLPELARIGGLDKADARPALDQLCDLQLVVGRPTGYTLADPLMREAAYRWLRPSVRRELHHRVAELAYVPAAVRAEHWLAAGEPALACAAALEAADEAAAVGDDAQLRIQLRTVRAFSEEHAEDGGDVGLLHERLAEVAVRLGRRWEAEELVEQDPTTARSVAQERPPNPRRPRVRPSETDAGPPPAGAEAGRASAADLVHLTVPPADDAEDVASRIEAQILLARAAGQRRDFDLAELAAKNAMAMAEAVRDDARFVRSALSLVQVPALLGDGLRHRELLHRIWLMSRTGRVAAVDDGLALTWCVVLHDLGSPDFERTWRQTTASVRDAVPGQLRALLEVHLLLESDQPRRARLLLDRLDGPHDAVVTDATRILRARLLVGEGDVEGAVCSLGAVLAERPSGPSLLAPEAGARLSALLASRDLDAARTQLEQARSLAGDRTFPREQVLMLRAGAEILLADGNPSGAATVALAAAMTASRAGLVVCEAAARDRHHRLLAASGVLHQRGRQPSRSDLDSLSLGGE